MNITVKLFAHFKAYLPAGSANMSARMTVDRGATAEDVLRRLGVPLPECRLALINGITNTTPDEWLRIVLSEGDTLAVMPNIH